MNFVDLDRTLKIVHSKYAARQKEVEKAIFAISAAFCTYTVLKLTSYFPDNWIVLLSVLNFFLGLRNSTASFFLIIVGLTLSLVYQNVVVGIITFFILLFFIPDYDTGDRISQALSLSVVPLMFYRAEFFPIIASALLYGHSSGFKKALLAFISGLFFANVLPYNTFGHFTLEFSNSLISNLKPQASSFTISDLFNFDNISLEQFRVFFTNISTSRLLPIMLVSYIFVGVFPAYVRDALQRFGRMWLLAALLISSYAVFFFINFIYYTVPGFELTFVNLASLLLSVITAWLVYLVFSYRPQSITEEGAIITSQDESAEQEVMVSEGTRVDALRRKLEEGDED